MATNSRKNRDARRLASLRSRKLSSARRTEIARHAARARWGNRRATAEPGPTRPIEEIAAELAAEVPPREWALLPSDLTDHLDHYLYGLPKR